jgi:hypothetical protein
MFAKDERPVPNIVAIYERPRHKIRRDATHVLGGMFGWNTSEETARALRGEDTRAEAVVTTTSIPDSGNVADPTISGPSQRCGKRSIKRIKRRALVPLAEMGASILSLRFQELMRRQQEVDEKEDKGPASAAPVKRSIAAVDDAPLVANSAAATKRARVSLASGDPPTAKKLRLTISTAPLDTTSASAPLQLPPSPPDTSSNASKAPADERLVGPIFSSTPNVTQDHLPEFDLSNLGAAFSLSSLDSDSDSESTLESSSESSSDSPDLSSSTSTRSTPQGKGKGKANENSNKSTATVSRNNTPSAPATSTRNPSTPPRKRKRQAHQPGWVGWVQTEE